MCPAPSQPERVSFEPIGSNGIKLNWLAAPVPTYEDRSPDSEVFYEVKISGGRTGEENLVFYFSIFTLFLTFKAVFYHKSKCNCIIES